MNLVCGVNLSIGEVGEMEEVALIGKIRGWNPFQEEMEIWVRKT